MMKKLLVLMLVLGMASLANAALLTTPYVNGIVTWDIVGGQLIGEGTSTGLFNGFLSQGLITPDPSTDGSDAGLMLIAGNASSVADFGGVVWNVHAEHASQGEGVQATGDWFVFDIIGPGEVTLYADNQSIIGTIAVVPEPITMVLLGIGGLFLRRRK